MHVLQVLPKLDVGGVERGILDLAKGLLARGHRVSVVSAGGTLVEPLLRMGAMHYPIPVDRKSLRSAIACIPALVEIIRSRSVDIVHARSRVPAWIALAAARRTQRPFITTAHGFYSKQPASRVMGWGRLVIAPSQALAQYMQEAFHVPKTRLRVIPRGINLEEFPYQPLKETHTGPWHLGLFGRVSRIKGHEVAIRALSQLVQEGLSVKLSITGSPDQSPLTRRLAALIKHLKLDDAVEWIGVREDIASAIASVDVALVPSTYPESFGRGVTEAQAVGRPVIASRIGALPELIEEGLSGLLVPVGDAAALAAAVKRYVHDDALRAKVIEEGRRLVQERWNLDSMVEQTLAVYQECLNKIRILVWKLSALGDVILSVPSLRAIRKHYPDSHITLAVGRKAYEVVARCPYVNDILIYDPRKKDQGARQMGFIRRLKQADFDLSIDLQNSKSTHFLSWISRIPVRVGYRRKWGGLLNRGVRLPKVVMAPIAHQHYLLKEAGIAPAEESLELWPSEADQASAERLLAFGVSESPRPLIGMHPGGSGRWKTKRWDLDRWAKLCDTLTQRGFRVVLTGGPDEQDVGATLVQLTQTSPHVLIGKTSLMELACLIERFDAFIAHDSSSLHLASAMGTPTVALFGPTDPARHLPPRFKGTVIRKKVFCSPCYSTRCRTITHACMKKITVEEVLETLLKEAGTKSEATSAASATEENS